MSDTAGIIEPMSGDDVQGLAGMVPGPELCARLAAIEPGAVPDAQVLELVSARARQLAYDQAHLWAVLADLAGRDPLPNMPEARALRPDEIFEYAVDEVRAELRMTRRTARRELDHAVTVAAVPAVLAALAAGQIDRARAIVLAEGCWDLTDTQAEKLLAEVLPEAGEVTAGTLSDRVRRVAVALDPAWAERRYREAIRDRRLIGYLNPDGSATVSAQYLPADQAATACARVDALAAAAKRAGVPARTDELRVELFLGLLDGSLHGLSELEIVAELLRRYPKAVEPSAPEPAPTGPAPTEPTPTAPGAARPMARRGVELRVGLSTLMGLDERPAELAGWGTVTAPVARDIAARQTRAQWRFAILDTAGRMVFDGTTRRRPAPADSGPTPAAPPAAGGVVELHVAAELLDNRDIASRHPEWSDVLADLTAQYARQQPIDQDPAARFPGRRLRRRVQLRFQRCIGVGCNRPASQCEQDHRRDHSRGGRTDEANLAPGCSYDHSLKTRRGWRLVQLDDATYRWTSPLGRRHIVRVKPVSPPLPGPIPRELPAPAAEAWWLAGDDDARPTFEPCQEPADPAVGHGVVRHDDPDPPPF